MQETPSGVAWRAVPENPATAAKALLLDPRWSGHSVRDGGEEGPKRRGQDLVVAT